MNNLPHRVYLVQRLSDGTRFPVSWSVDLSPKQSIQQVESLRQHYPAEQYLIISALVPQFPESIVHLPDGSIITKSIE